MNNKLNLRFLLLNTIVTILIQFAILGNIPGQEAKLFGVPKEYSNKSLRSGFNKTSAIKLVNQLQLDGYLSASLDSIKQDTSNNETITNYYFYSGTKYDFNSIELDSITNDYINQAGLSEKLLNKNMDKAKLLQIIQNMLTFYENNGYPFCQINMSKSKLKEEQITPIFTISKGPFIQIDSIIIKGNCKTSKTVIQNNIGIYKGTPYSESKIQSIDKTIQSITYLKQIKPTAIEFTDKKAKVYLYLDDAKSSKLNGIIGVQPSKNGKVTFTGEATAKLENTLKKGEQIKLKWNKINLLSQSLNTNLIYPYIAKTKFGTDLNFNLYKRDTSYLEINYKTGAAYTFKPNNYLNVYYEGTQNILLSKQPEINSNSLMLDMKKNAYGITFAINNTNYKFNPTKGFVIYLDASIGHKKIIRNPNIDSSYYENISLSSLQWSGTVQLEGYIPIGKRSTLLLRNVSKTIQNKNIYFNELYRFGGNSLLRGFNEQSLFASTISVNTLEYRLLLEQNSYLFSFFDYGWYEQNLTTKYLKDTPYSFGGGIAFETGPGIFSLQYALGAQMNNPILLKTGKIHFGFINYF